MEVEDLLHEALIGVDRRHERRESEAAAEGDLAAGVFWVTTLFAAVLAVNRQFVAEREEGGFDGFLLAPVDRTALFVAKATVLFCFLVALELVAVPAFAVLLLEPSPWPGMLELVAVLLLADAGIAVVGTLVGALAAAGAEALPGRWLAVLGLYDLVFGLLAYAVFDFLLED